MKKTFLVSCLVIFTFFPAIIFIGHNSLNVNAQGKTIEKWEYGAITNVFYFQPEAGKVNKIIAIVEFCQMNLKGCERKEFRHELDYAKFLTEAELAENLRSRNLASLKASEIVFQKALAQLGINGWEMINQPDLEFKPISLYEYEKLDDKSFLLSRDRTRAVYFKKLMINSNNEKK
jgi:hypothetical protein